MLTEKQEGIARIYFEADCIECGMPIDISMEEYYHTETSEAWTHYKRGFESALIAFGHGHIETA